MLPVVNDAGIQTPGGTVVRQHPLGYVPGVQHGDKPVVGSGPLDQRHVVSFSHQHGGVGVWFPGQRPHAGDNGVVRAALLNGKRPGCLKVGERPTEYHGLPQRPGSRLKQDRGICPGEREIAVFRNFCRRGRERQLGFTTQRHPVRRDSRHPFRLRQEGNAVVVGFRVAHHRGPGGEQQFVEIPPPRIIRQPAGDCHRRRAGVNGIGEPLPDDLRHNVRQPHPGINAAGMDGLIQKSNTGNTRDFPLVFTGALDLLQIRLSAKNSVAEPIHGEAEGKLREVLRSWCWDNAINGAGGRFVPLGPNRRVNVRSRIVAHPEGEGVNGQLVADNIHRRDGADAVQHDAPVVETVKRPRRVAEVNHVLDGVVH